MHFGQFFEIRRVGAQIMPLLARLLCLRTPETVFSHNQPQEGSDIGVGGGGTLLLLLAERNCQGCPALA